MKKQLQQMILAAAQRAFECGQLSSADFPGVEIEVPKITTHGDFSTNLAMVMASTQRMPPRKIAQAISGHLVDAEGLLNKTEIAGPGFINFYVKPAAWLPVLTRIHATGAQYGACDLGQGRKIQVEFVSSNPTGPLHVGHGRGAAVGDSTARILKMCGYDVQREYYINDSGRQINTLGRSVFLRYRQLLGETVEFPAECYQGDYIRDFALQIQSRYDRTLLSKETDAAIDACARFAAERIIAQIRQDLADFGVTFDHWFSEQSLYDSGKVEAVIERFRRRGTIYTLDGAEWFRTTDFGDEKDRVVIRSNGQTTYFASDIAYHEDKFDRGFHLAIDVWGADHHGYIPRVTAAIEAGGHSRDQFRVILVQLVNLLRGGEPVAMSTRAGEFVTLADVLDEVGRDAARFIFLTRHHESTLDFDLEVAKQKSNDNPVYYVQYVHARIASIIRKATERGFDRIVADTSALLTTPEEIQLIKILARYPEIVRLSGELMEPHRVAFFLMNLAAGFHSYYNKHRVLMEDPDLTNARLYLVMAVKQVIRNGLDLLGVGAPEQM